MKDKKNLLLLLPILVFVGTFFLISKLDKRSYAINSDTAEVASVIPEGTVYKMIRKNTYSWHLITHNFSEATSTNASGTKLLETRNEIDGSKYKAVTYCASEGQRLLQANSRTRYSIDSSKVKSLNKVQKTKLKTVMPYMYPYVNLGASSSDANTLKALLKSDKGLNAGDYDNYHFDDLNVNEAITAVQAAIWNIQKKHTDVYFAYRMTISSFGAFDSCSDYHDNKILTTEEESWWNKTECDAKRGNFYKYVVKHTKDSNTENRINTLINWYINILPEKVASSTVTEHFDLQDSSFSGNTLTATFDTNITSYDIIFTSEAGDELLAANNASGNTFTINNIDPSVKMVNVEVRSKTMKPQVFYYIASSGQDFIGLEKSYYTRKEKFNIQKSEEFGNIIIYKVGNKAINVEVKDNNGTEFDVSECGGAATNCLSNAKFELYYQNKTNLIDRIETNYSDLTTVTFNNLPLGTYYLKETQPAEGYDLYLNGTSLTDRPVDSEGFIVIELTGNGLGTQTKAVVVNNESTKLCVEKIDSANPNKVLTGATLEIEDIDGNVLTSFTTSEEEGSYCFDPTHHGSLQTGSFFIREIQAPRGFSLDSKRYHFIVGHGESEISSLDDIGSYKTLTVANNKITLVNKKGFTMTKSDLTDGACVTGAKLTIKNSSGNVVTSWISTCKDSNGQGEDSHTVPVCITEDDQNDYASRNEACLTPGTYTLVEEIHPDGYATAESMEFTVANDGKITGSGDMKDAPIEVCIYKVAKDSKDPLVGAEFEVYKKISQDGESDKLELYKSFVSSKEPCIPYFPVGEYVVKETKAPDGYVLPDDNETEIVVKDMAGHQDFYIEDEPYVPKTDMNYSQLIIIIASIFMMVGLGLVGYYGYKKQHQ